MAASAIIPLCSRGEADVAQVPYYFEDDPDAEDRWKAVTVMQEGLSKPLAEVVHRLDLLGYTHAYCAREFQYFADLNQFDDTVLTFDRLRSALISVDVHIATVEGVDVFGGNFPQGVCWLFSGTALRTVRYAALDAAGHHVTLIYESETNVKGALRARFNQSADWTVDPIFEIRAADPEAEDADDEAE
ncbi:MAG: hypothetical protein DCF16_17490 [Alphaproteobacteria bacterium]|nr:MAG: hypothetical protein DCF16_17490 [Alphaproteobacteria bacterium]